MDRKLLVASSIMALMLFGMMANSAEASWWYPPWYNPTYTYVNVTNITEVSYSSNGMDREQLEEAMYFAVLWLQDDYSWINGMVKRMIYMSKARKYSNIGTILDSYFASDEYVVSLENKVSQLEQRIAALENQ